MINIQKSTQAYLDVLSKYTNSIEIDKSFNDYTKLDLLSETLLAFTSIEKIYPIDKIKIDNITYTYYKNINNLDIENQNYKNITIAVKDITYNTHINLLQCYGSFLYYAMLEENDESIISSMEHLTNKLIDIFLNRDYDNLQTYNNITMNSSTYLYHLAKPKELFGRAFKSYILNSLYKDGYNTLPIDFTQEDLSLYQEDISDILSLFFNNKEHTLNTIENHHNIIHIALNEERRLLKYKNIDNNKDEKVLTILQDNLDTYINKYNINLQEYSIDKDFTDLDIDNLNSFKNSINDMNIETIYTLNDSLLEDIEALREIMSNTELDIQTIEGEIITGKRNKKDLSLESLLRFLFMLSMEYNNKIKMQKALDNSDAACSHEYIYYSEDKEKENAITSHILSTNKSKSESKLFKVSEIRTSIAKMYGVSLYELESAINNMEHNKGYGSNSNFIRLRLSNNKPSKVQDIKTTHNNIENTNNINTIQKDTHKFKKTKIHHKKPHINKCDAYLNALIKNKIKKKGLGRYLSAHTNNIDNALIKENKSALSNNVDTVLSNLLDEAHNALIEMKLQKEKEQEKHKDTEFDLEK